MRERQKKAAKDWLSARAPVEVRLNSRSEIVLEWDDPHSRKRSITGNHTDTVDSLLATLTQKTWEAWEAEDRKNEPTYDRT